METAETIAKRQPMYRRNGDKWLIPCPSPHHQGDRDSCSCSFWDGEGGPGDYGAVCFSHGCSQSSILEGLGIKPRTNRVITATKPRPKPQVKPREPYEAPAWAEQYKVAEYEHVDGGELVPAYRREYPADFPEGPCSWMEWKGKEKVRCNKTEPHKHCWGPSPVGTRPLKWLKDNGTEALVVVEGEPAARALAMHLTITGTTGYIPVSWKGGAQAIDKVDYSDYKGRNVILWPDDDKAGREAMKLITNHVYKAGAVSVSRVFNDGETKMDAADCNPVQSINFIKSAKKLKNKAEKERRIESEEVNTPIPISKSTLELYQDQNAGIVEIFIENFADKLLLSWSSDNEATLYWLSKVGVWRRNVKEIESSYMEAASIWYEREINKIADDEGLSDRKKGSAQAIIRKKFSAGTSSSVSMKRILTLATAMASLMARESKLPEEVTECRDIELDAATYLMGAQNGVVDLRDGSLHEGADAAKLLVTKQVNVKYVPWQGETESDRSSNLFSENIGWTIENYLWAVIGKSLHGRVDRRFYIIQGKTSGGKTSMFNVIQGILGNEYSSAIHTDAIAQSKGGRSAGLSPELEPFCENRVVVTDEAEQISIDAGRLKQVTGDSQISFRGLHRDLQTKIAIATMFMPLNRVPNFKSDDTAIQSRMRVIPIPPVPAELVRPNWVNETMADTELLEQVFGRLVHNAVEYQNTYPSDPAKVTEATIDKIDEDKGEVGMWLENLLVEDTQGRVDGKMVWEAAIKNFGAKQDDLVISGWTQRRMVNSLKEMYNLPVARTMRIGTRVAKGWEGYRIRGLNE